MRERQFRLLLVANISAVLGTIIVSPIMETLTGPFGVSEARIGLLMTAFTVTPVIGIPACSMLSDRYGRKPVLITSLVLFGLAGAAIALTSDFRVALGLRALQGVGYSGITPVLVTAIGDLYLDEREATAQGLRFTSSGLSQAAFPLLAGALVTVSWRYPFAIYLIAVPIAILLAIYFDEPSPVATQHSTDGGEPDRVAGDAPDSAKGGSPDRAEAGDLDSADHDVPDAADSGYRGQYLVELGKLAGQPRILSVLFAYAAPPLLYIGFLSYISFLVVRVFGSTAGVASVFISLASLLYAVSASQAGRVTEYFDSRTIPLIVGNGLMGVGLVVTALAPGLAVAVVGTAIMGLGIGLCFSLLRSVLVGLSPDIYRGGVVGLGELVIRLASSLGPLVVGALLVFFTVEVGPEMAIRYALVVVGIGSALLGMAAIVAARLAPPVPGS